MTMGLLLVNPVLHHVSTAQMVSRLAAQHVIQFIFVIYQLFQQAVVSVKLVFTTMPLFSVLLAI